MRSWIVVAVLAAGACSGAAPREAEHPAGPGPGPSASAEADAEPAASGDFDAPDDAPPAVSNAIDRAVLVGVLDAGPGAFLGTVRVEAFFRAQRFAGWKVVGLDDRYRDAGLEPGDVVTGANGIAITRPEHLADVFAKLRQADQLVVAAERDGKPFELVFPIVGAAPAPAPARGQK